MDFPMAALIAVVTFLVFTLGNQLGDQATFRDCATTGSPTLVGGGKIECKVLRETGGSK